jgi:hypothetical protein
MNSVVEILIAQRCSDFDLTTLKIHQSVCIGVARKAIESNALPANFLLFPCVEHGDAPSNVDERRSATNWLPGELLASVREPSFGVPVDLRPAA